jgi:Flp pilus assembly protein TadD
MPYCKAIQTMLGAHLGRVAALLYMGEPQFTLAACDAVLANQPAHPDALRLKCSARTSLRRYGEALSIVYKQLDDSPESAELWHAKARLLLRQHEWAEAIHALDEALNRGPERYSAWMSKGDALLELGNPAEALSAFDRALALQPDNKEAQRGRAQARVAWRTGYFTGLLPELLFALMEIIGR